MESHITLHENIHAEIFNSFAPLEMSWIQSKGEGIETTQTELKSPINHALVPKTHTPMYLTHKYWARKPHNVVAEYIDHYARCNEIVLDCFAGSGVTVFEALRLGVERSG